MGESVTEGTVSRWLYAVGDTVATGDALVEVTTDKVDVEVPSPSSGTLVSITADEGVTVAVGATLGAIAPGASNAGAKNGRGRTPAKAAALDGGGNGPGPSPSSAAPASTSPASAPVPPANGGNAPAPNVSMLARRAAAVRGIDVARVTGSGPGGIVRRADIDAAAAPSLSPEVAPIGEVTPLRGPAAVLAGFMEHSLTIPTATSFRTLCVDVLDARRKELNAALKQSGSELKVSFTHIIGYAIGQATVDHPSMTAHFARDAGGKPTRVQPGAHLGLAVDSRRKDGSRFLVVPVIRDVASQEFARFHHEFERLIALSRSNTLVADDLRGASMTLTNPGGIGTVASVPRLMDGQGTIVATGAIGWPPGMAGVGDPQLRALGVGKVMTVSSTYDHRVIQGAESGEFLARIEALLTGADAFYERIFASLKLPAPAPRPPVPEPAPRAAVAITGPAAPGALSGAPARRGADHELLEAVTAGMSLVKAHRTHGHLAADLDPLGTQPIGDPSLDPRTVHLTREDMLAVPADVLRVYVPGETLADVIPNLHQTYCGTIAFEIEHISSHQQRVWLREHIESGAYRQPTITPEHRVRLLRRLSKVDAMERYFRKTFIGQKTFSIEGLDTMVPMVVELLNMVVGDGVGQVVLGMAHRGRLAMIGHVVNHPYESILVSFEQGDQRRALGGGGSDPTGDVKYHLGATGTYLTETQKPLTVRLLPNPSHLEVVNAVVEGWTRAEQTRRGASTLHLDPTAALPLLIHGDAAFPGQGVVSEVLNMQSLPGYTTGGTVHIIANNQIGFTTLPQDSRSTHYASDLAKGFDCPIIHVNADDVEACIHAIRLAYDYRRTYHRDVVIDLIGYRRFGHNEGDEPNYTQPVMYERIRKHPTVREIYVDKLVGNGLITNEAAAAMSEQYYERVRVAHDRVKQTLAVSDSPPLEPLGHHVGHPGQDVHTGVARDTLHALNEQLITFPDGFTLNPKMAKQLAKRRESVDGGLVDWGTAESLAFGSLLMQDRPIRLTGQDTERGTFSQRHLVFHDARNGRHWVPMLHVVGATAAFELHNSPLSEAAALGFEYGYSAATPDTLVIWEAQFGDFVNNAQGVIDQFISSGWAKWGQRSRLTLLLPHGYEGAGPEHSSARLERFLALAAFGNMRVANCTTTGQYFHLLRDQALTDEPRPLVIMTPKSLLRKSESMDSLDVLVEDRFHKVIDDPTISDRDAVQTLLLCTGKIYYELAQHPLRQEVTDLAIARIEQLDPLPIDETLDLIRSYPRLEQIFWVQEEPSNMGAWLHLARPIGRRRPYEIRWDYIGRPRRASPSEGFNGAHLIEQERILTTAVTMSRQAQERTVEMDSPHTTPAT